jgi:hypothetical protein
VTVDNSTLHDKIRQDPNVLNVEQNHLVKAHFDRDDGPSMKRPLPSRAQRLKRYIQLKMENLYWPAQMVTARTKQSKLGGPGVRYTVKAVNEPGKGSEAKYRQFAKSIS